MNIDILIFNRAEKFIEKNHCKLLILTPPTHPESGSRYRVIVCALSRRLDRYSLKLIEVFHLCDTLRGSGFVVGFGRFAPSSAPCPRPESVALPCGEVWRLRSLWGLPREPAPLGLPVASPRRCSLSGKFQVCFVRCLPFAPCVSVPSPPRGLYATYALVVSRSAPSGVSASLHRHRLALALLQSPRKRGER